jgi:DNA-binding LacI/PurR family transcriptional regulator
MSAAAAEAGYGFILLPSADERAFPLPRFLRERRFDGAIVVDPLRTNTLIPLLRRHTVPLVTTGRYQGKDGSALPWVDNDNRGGLTQLLDHLRDQGYERPAMISMKGGSYATDIEEVFASAVAGTIVRAAAISDNEGYRLGRRLLQGRDPPDAILTAGDRQAVGVLRAARELGVAVPSSLGVAGAGDTVLAAHSNPQLTSIRVSVRQLGELSVRCLLSLLDGGDAEIEGTILPTKLVVRASTRRERTRRQRTR